MGLRPLDPRAAVMEFEARERRFGGVVATPPAPQNENNEARRAGLAV